MLKILTESAYMFKTVQGEDSMTIELSINRDVLAHLYVPLQSQDIGLRIEAGDQVEAGMVELVFK